MSQDTIYQQKREQIAPFQFNQAVANVFDNMIERSVPIYAFVHEIVLEVLQHSYQPGSRIYDLGCSTGSTLAIVEQYLRQNNITSPIIGIDNSAPMLEKAREKLAPTHHIELLAADVTQVDFQPAGLIVMNYTLQFIPIPQRQALLKKIYDCLLPNGVLLLAEKLASPNPVIHQLLNALYRNYKRHNDYSELEIAQKREALDKVLQPLPAQDHLQQLSTAGFSHPELIVRWYNFGCFMAVKSA